jgi:NitT/TauT family transport system substrate-binding protein
MDTRRVPSPSLLLPALLLSLGSCDDNEAVRQLRIGMNPWPGYAHLAVAQELGLFAAQGLEVRIVEYASLHDLRRGFAAGQIDVLPSTLIEVLGLLAEPGRQPAVIWVADASQGGDRLLARGCERLADLRGRRIAYEPATLGAYLLRRALDHAELDEHDVAAIGMDQIHMQAALAGGRIDAAITYPPYAEQMLAVPGVRTLFSSASIPDEVIDTICVERSLIERDPTLVTRLHAALVATEQRLRDEPEATRTMKARVTGMTVEDFAAARAGMVVYSATDQRDWLAPDGKLSAIAARVGHTLGHPPDWTPPCLLAPGIERSPLLAPAGPR